MTSGEETSRPAMTDTAALFARMLHHGPIERMAGDLLQPPIVPAAIYHVPGDPQGPHQYGRWSNPSWDAVEEALGILEAAEVIAVPAGMAAIAGALYALCSAGDRVLLPSDGYMATRVFADTFLKPMGVTVDTCPTVEVASRDLTGYRLVLVETPSNPGLDICDIRAVATNAKLAGALLAADNTTMTPLGQRPLDLGADIVVASDTKALNGHSDALFGHVATCDPEIATKVRNWRKLVGAIPSPFDAFLVHRGLETLELRFERMCASAETIAARLWEHPAVEAVVHPSLPTHPAYALAATQMLRAGTLIAVTLASKDAAERFISGCPMLRQATSFGSLHSSAERRKRWGDQVADGFVRLSIGCEPVEPLWAALKGSLDAV
jgi:cystathionine gamma-lyase